MKRNHRILFLALGAAAIFSATLALAGPVGFTIPFFTVDSGGGRSTGGPYVVTGTIGQHDAGTMSGGPYQVRGGFWGGAGALTRNGVQDWQKY